MKTKIYYLIIVMACIICACQPNIMFTEPQPADVSTIPAFPKRIQGKYLNTNDSSLVHITENAIIRMYDYVEKIHVSQLDSSQQIIGDSVFDVNTNLGVPVHFEGDTLLMRVNEADTLFAITDKNVLKKFKGYYFLNTYWGEGNYEVQELEFSHSKFTLSKISKSEDLAALKTITESAQDTIPYAFSPSRQQFKKFIRSDGFKDREVFWRVSQ